MGNQASNIRQLRERSYCLGGGGGRDGRYKRITLCEWGDGDAIDQGRREWRFSLFAKVASHLSPEGERRQSQLIFGATCLEEA